MPEHPGPLQELVARNHAIELRIGHETIGGTLDLTGPRGTGRAGDRPEEALDFLQERRDDASLSDPRRAGDDE